MMTKKRPLASWLCLAGILALIAYVLHDVLGGLSYPGYSWLRQAVSDLTATGAPSFTVANGLATVYGLLSCLGCVMVCIAMENQGNKPFRAGVYLFAVMNWVSGVGFSLFPLSQSGFGQTFQDIMHLIVTILVVGLSIASLIAIGIGGLKLRGPFRGLGIIAFVSLLCMFIGSAGVNLAPSAYFGLVERFGTYSAVVFGAVLGAFAFRGLGDQRTNVQPFAPSSGR